MGYWQFSANKIALTSDLQGDAAVMAAAVIAHEATHVDYAYDPEKYIALTLSEHPELAREDLNIYKNEFGEEALYSIYDPETNTTTERIYLGNSIDQEYRAFYNTNELWKESGNHVSDPNNDYVQLLLEQSDGEELLKEAIRDAYSGELLPEY